MLLARPPAGHPLTAALFRNVPLLQYGHIYGDADIAMPRSKSRVLFVCDACKSPAPKWEGRCPSCGEWNSLIEVETDGRDGQRLHRPTVSAQALSEVETDEVARIELSSGEANRVLGGGIVPGSLALVAGEPGIGKSTLLLRLAADVSAASGKALYVSGEESAAQIKLRADRLGIAGQDLMVLTTTDIEDVLGQLDSEKPALAVIDSIQTMHDASVRSDPGSVTQIKECTRRLMLWSKENGVPIILSGHVTKGGDIAGPRVLEHIVDVVLYMDGDPISSWRMLRTTKNRFGSTNEVGVFEMTEAGLIDVSDPSRTFLAGRRERAVGSVIVSTMEGSRPLLLEIQALTSPSALPAPRRVATGVNFNRLLVLCAVLTRRLRMPLSNQDVVVNVAGGLKVEEPAADLAVALAIASSLRDSPLDPDLAAVGEVGLSGEVRGVPQIERRLREIARLGLRRCVVPAGTPEEASATQGVEVTPVSTLAEAVRACLPRPSSNRRSSPTEDQGGKL